MSELIKISKEFKGAMGGVWLGKEVEIPDGADDIAEYIKQNERLEKAWMAMNPQINWLPTTESSYNGKSETLPSKESAIESHIKTINECQTLNNLNMFKRLVENTNDTKLLKAFNDQYEKLLRKSKS